MQRVKSLVPMLFVQSVPSSIQFYARLGFEVGNTFTPESQPEPTWAWLKSDGAHLMLAKASHPVDASQQGLLVYMYCEDVIVFYSQLKSAGVQVGELTYPFYSPQGEFRIKDLDGYDIEISHT
jgi:glyoxalase/bleomycin resistance protein/dioxygenase superfamily protein